MLTLTGADEMEVSGWVLFTEKEHASWKRDVQAAFEHRESWTVGVGTNEEIEFNSHDEFTEILNTRVLTADEAAVLLKLFGDQYGFSELILAIPEMFAEDDE